MTSPFIFLSFVYPSLQPTTLNPPPRQPGRPAFGGGGGGRGGGRGGDKFGGPDKKMGPGADFRPSYRDDAPSGGFGRGAPM